MTILGIKLEPYRKNSQKKVERLFLKCDECGKNDLCSRSSYKRNKKRMYHFCSRDCSIKSHLDGVLFKKRTQTNIEKYGASCFAASVTGRMILNKIFDEKYGGYPLTNKEVLGSLS